MCFTQAIVAPAFANDARLSLVWEESQKLGGIDPDFHRRDLWDAIEGGAGAEWDLGVQLFEDNEDQSFAGIDLLDPTKIVPEELAPVEIVGRLTPDRNPTNYFAETEQVAFCTAHVPRGIDFTDDPLLQARNFSYLDTQLTRLGGPTFDQLPINRSQAPVNSNHRDGFGLQAIHEGRRPLLQELARRGLPLPCRRRRVQARAPPGCGFDRSGAPAVVRRPLHPGDDVLE